MLINMNFHVILTILKQELEWLGLSIYKRIQERLIVKLIEGLLELLQYPKLDVDGSHELEIVA